MKILKPQIKNKGFLLIATVVLIFILFASFMITYKIVTKRGKRISAITQKIKIDEKKEILEVLLYDEVKKADKLVSNGIYENHSEYIGYIENHKRLWFGVNQEKSKNEFEIYEMRCNNNCFFPSQLDNFNYFNLMKNEFQKLGKRKKTFSIKLMKRIKNSVTNEKINLIVIVELEYKGENKNLLNPDKEQVKEYIIEFEK